MPPDVRVENWPLTVKGLVKSPFSLTYRGLLERPTQSEIVTLECVGNGVAGEAIGTAEWEGVSLKTLLDEAGVSSKAYDVMFGAADGYSDSFTVERGSSPSRPWVPCSHDRSWYLWHEKRSMAHGD